MKWFSVLIVLFIISCQVGQSRTQDTIYIDQNSGAQSPDGKYSLEQNYPNPFNPTTSIRFSIKEESDVIVKIFNIIGEEVQTLIREKLKEGLYQINWNADRFSSGIYYYRIIAGEYGETKKMILIK